MSWTDGVLAIFVPANAATSINAYLAELELLASDVARKPLRVRVESPQVSLEDQTTSQQRIAEHPLIKQAMELLNARIVGVQPRAPKPPT